MPGTTSSDNEGRDDALQDLRPAGAGPAAAGPAGSSPAGYQVRSYSEIEPLPRIPDYLRTLRPVVITLLAGLLVTYAGGAIHPSPWWALADLPCIALSLRSLLFVRARGRRFRAELAGWRERKDAYYDGLLRDLYRAHPAAQEDFPGRM